MSFKPSQKSLANWTKQDWGTKSGKNSIQGKNATGERYLPKRAIQNISDTEYAASSAAKRKASAAGKQVSKQPKKIAKKTARFR